LSLSSDLGVELTRPGPAPDRGPLDDAFYDLAEDHFRRVIRDHPIVATYLGIHAADSELGDGSRDAVLGELDADRRHLAAVEAIDPAGLSNEARIERDLEIHNVRRSIFDTDVVRTWERRSLALESVGDALYLLFARDFAPLAERLDSIASRLEGLPAHLGQHRTRALGPQVRLWQRLEMESAESLPGLIWDIVAAASGTLGERHGARLHRAAETAAESIGEYRAWLEDSLAKGSDDWALGREHYDELVGLRALEGLDSDQILAIGWEQLAAQKAARVEAARRLDPSVDEATVVDRVKSDHPATFGEALDAYRQAMTRARQYLIDHRIATVPDDEQIIVRETPRYLRHVIPFAAYFEAPKFDLNPTGLYIVTSAVHDDPDALREHYRASISNTSVHEAYPGHHLQFAVGNGHPSLSRLMTDAPEFVEGWAMYTEQMMREEGFDDAPEFQVAVATDAIWRACRIILDVRMHRGELSVAEATDFLVEHTGFVRDNAAAEIDRYTFTPTYQFSYLLGKVLIQQLRADEERRLGAAFDLRAFHDALLRNGSIPISFHRRLLTAGV
jgi:uncharacterized protein (DUF885 family)